MARPYCTVCGKGATHLNEKTGDTRCEKHITQRGLGYHIIKE